MIELEDRPLELPVEHYPVGDHDDLVEDRLVVVAEQVRQPVRKPRDRIGLPRPGRMLDEVVMPRPALSRVADHRLHRMPLMEPGKDERRGMRALPRALLARRLDMHEPLQDLQPVIPLPDIAPKIRNIITIIRNGPWVPRPPRLTRPARAEVKRQELGFPPLEPRRDEGAVGVNREVHERPPREERVVLIPVPVLGDRIALGVLPGVRVLELHGRDRQPVEEERHVNRLARIPEAEVQLPRHGQHVRVVLIKRIVGDRQPRPEVREVNLHPPVLHPLPQHVKHPPRVNLRSHPQRELPLRGIRIPAVQLNQLVPPLDLGPANELPHLSSGQPKLAVEILPASRRHPPPPQQLPLNPLLKGPLAKRPSTHTEIPPVTAAVINACLRSARSAGVEPIRLDVTNPADLAAAVQQAGDVQLVINNAGILHGSALLGPDAIDGARAEFETNVLGPLAVSRAFAPVLARNGGGAILGGVLRRRAGSPSLVPRPTAHRRPPRGR